MSDESMWSEFEGLWGMGIEELSDPDTTEDDGVLHRAPNYEKEGGESWEE